MLGGSDAVVLALRDADGLGGGTCARARAAAGEVIDSRRDTKSATRRYVASSEGRLSLGLSPRASFGCRGVTRMKTCPDCAESIQDAARKCRFCGFRFDAPTADAATSSAAASEESKDDEPDDEPDAAADDADTDDADADDADAADADEDDEDDEETNAERPTPARARPKSCFPYALVTAGGACVALGGLAMCYLLATGGVNPWITVGSFAFGGVLLACGWSVLLARGEAGFGAVAGSLLLSACWVFGASLDIGGGPSEQLAKGMLGTAGLLVCAFLHLGTLEEQDLDGARLAAMVACVGFGVQLFAISKQIALPDAVQTALMWAGMLGTLLFGTALVAGALSRWSEAKHG